MLTIAEICNNYADIKDDDVVYYDIGIVKVDRECTRRVEAEVEC